MLEVWLKIYIKNNNKLLVFDEFIVNAFTSAFKVRMSSHLGGGGDIKKDTVGNMSISMVYLFPD